MNNRVFRFAGLSLAALSVALAAPAIAQDNSTTVPQSGQPAPTQEAIPGDQSTQAQNGNAIVVTGLRRSETLQDTPAAITAFGSQEIVMPVFRSPPTSST